MPVWLFVLYCGSGLAYCIATPPFRTPDERNHFLRAYEISEGRLVPIQIGENSSGDELPVSVDRIVEVLGNPSDMHVTAEQFARARELPLNPNDRARVAFSTAIYAPLAYVPAAIAMMLARHCGAGPLRLSYVGRWANIAVAGALLAYAVAISGAARMTALLVSLFPMTISQVASLNADALSYAVGFAWVSLIALSAGSGSGSGSATLTRARGVQLLVLALALSQLRPPYPLLGALVFLIPAHRFGKGARAAAFYVAVITASIVPAVAWNATAAKLYMNAAPERHIAPREQLASIASKPKVFRRTLINSLAVGGPDYAREMVGKLGWLNVTLPSWIHFGFAIACLVSVFLGRPGSPMVVWWQRAGLLLVVAGGVIAIEITLYLTFTPVGVHGIWGVQGRYFTVLAFVAAFACAKPLRELQQLRLPLAVACMVFALSANAAAVWTMARAVAGSD
jgi:uncharacterized membrane protein